MSAPQVLRLYLIRHGETAGGGKLLGFTDPPLSDKGFEQARRLADKLASVQLAAVHSSNLLRAKATADVIAERHSLTAQVSATLREVNMGKWDGRAIDEIHAEAPEMVKQLFTDPASFRYPSGESFAEFATRVEGALERLRATHRSGTVAVVAHGGVCRAIIGKALGIPMRNWLRLAQDHACLNVIEYYDGNPLLRLLNGGLELEEASRTLANTRASSQPAKLVEGEDYYYEGGLMVFTARYHLRRGYCCRSGCRHCPYGEAARQ